MQDSRSIRELIACQKPGWSLEQRFYTDADIFRLELDRVINRHWICAGHQSQIPEPGDFRVIDVASESAIVVRGKDHRIRAFANVCRHRGSLVCLESSGNTRIFECPYHGWRYELDGSLFAARNMPEDFAREDYGLNPVQVEIVHGLVFVCFCDDPPSLDSARRDLEEPMRLFGFPGLKVAAQKSYPIAANWKLAVENYQECYHCAPAHPDYAKMHTLMLDSEKLERVQGHMLERMEACGLKNITVAYEKTMHQPGQEYYGYSRTAMFDGYRTGSRDGQPVAPLLGELKDYDGGASDLTIGPLSYFLAYSDHVVGYVFTPVDLGNCRCEVYWFVRGDAEEGRDYDVDELTWLWDRTTLADEKIIVNNWKGVNSSYYRPGPLSRMERTEQRFVDWLLGELRRAPRLA